MLWLFGIVLNVRRNERGGEKRRARHPLATDSWVIMDNVAPIAEWNGAEIRIFQYSFKRGKGESGFYGYDIVDIECKGTFVKRSGRQSERIFRRAIGMGVYLNLDIHVVTDCMADNL